MWHRIPRGAPRGDFLAVLVFVGARWLMLDELALRASVFTALYSRLRTLSGMLRILCTQQR
jgi:hypothetical protein